MKKIAIPAVLAVAGSVLVATPASADSASGATLTWKISECAFDATIASCGSITEAQSLTGNVTKGGEGWAFTGGTGSYDPATGATAIDFTGSVTIGNVNRGNYSITFADPKVVVKAGSGALVADVVARPPGAPETIVGDVKIVDLPAVPNAKTWQVTPPWQNAGTPGVPAPIDGKQFAQPLLDALPASLKGWFWATGTSGANPYKAPAAVSVAFDSVPTSTGPAVTIEGAENLTADQQATITVKGTGFDPAKKGGPVQGLYVVFGPDAATVGYGMNAATTFGAAQYLPTAPNADGEFETTLTIKGRYTGEDGKSWDGTTQTLGVSTWAAHSHAITDYDTFTAITFRRAPAPAKVTFSLKKDTVKAGKRAVAVVRAPGVKGKVAVKKGSRTLATKRLSKGKAVVRLPRLKVGKHTLRAVFPGTAQTARSVSKRVVLRVR